MLTGKALGDAVGAAITLKGVSKAEVARHFNIKGPSIYDWIDHGRVGKRHLTRLVEYFSDVVGPEHWGLSNSSQIGGPSPLELTPDEKTILTHYRNAPSFGKEILRGAAEVVATPARKLHAELSRGASAGGGSSGADRALDVEHLEFVIEHGVKLALQHGWTPKRLARAIASAYVQIDQDEKKKPTQATVLRLLRSA